MRDAAAGGGLAAAADVLGSLDERRDGGGGVSGNANGATSPFRTSTEPPPKFSEVHAWGVMRWGRKAGVWGRGVEGVQERNKKDGKR